MSKLKSFTYRWYVKACGIFLCGISMPIFLLGFFGFCISQEEFGAGLSYNDMARAIFEWGWFSTQADAHEFVEFLLQGRIPFSILGVAVFVLSAIYLCFVCGHRPDSEDVKLRLLDRIPYGVVGFVWMMVAGSCFAALVDFVSYDLGIAEPTVFFALSISLFYTCFYLTMAFVLTTIVRIKAHMLWKTTFVYYCYRFIKEHCSNWPLHRLFRYIKENWEVGGKTVQHAAWLIGILTALEFIGLLLFDQTGVILFIWIFYRLLTIPFMLVLVLQWKKISQGIHRLVSGDIEHAIDTTGMYFDFKQDAENLNQVGDTVRRAVNQQMKSERLKTELITNVSHDIKTPLTSIINYVDLLQKEMNHLENPEEMNHLENPESRERQQEYLEVLSRQSNRLKKLIQDLIDASKATTGNIEVDIKPMVIDVILNQAIGEFEDRLHACNLELCVDEKVKEKTILADGRHLWRVFDNLLGNIVKYSLPGTRVYIDVDAVHFASGNRIGITFRNISKEKLNIAPEELMERFKRGDSSRNTEGSGLGLSIANSLVQLMDGEMQIHIDGDLFKVQLLLKEA